MERQRSMTQMKEQKKSLEKGLSEMEASKVPDREFRTVSTRMLKKLRGEMDEHSKTLKR